jgi:hypothetical protein
MINVKDFLTIKWKKQSRARGILPCANVFLFNRLLGLSRSLHDELIAVAKLHQPAESCVVLSFMMPFGNGRPANIDCGALNFFANFKKYVLNAVF